MSSVVFIFLCVLVVISGWESRSLLSLVVVVVVVVAATLRIILLRVAGLEFPSINWFSMEVGTFRSCFNWKVWDKNDKIISSNNGIGASILTIHSPMDCCSCGLNIRCIPAISEISVVKIRVISNPSSFNLNSFVIKMCKTVKLVMYQIESIHKWNPLLMMMMSLGMYHLCVNKMTLF